MKREEFPALPVSRIFFVIHLFLYKLCAFGELRWLIPKGRYFSRP